jgi:hypothetical protein
MSFDVHGMAWFAGTLRAWHLAILRYCRDFGQCRLAVLRIARELDRLYPRQDGSTDFEFFRRTSAELCAAIVQPNERASAVLQQYLARFDDDRLKRTFAAAIDAGQPAVSPISRPARPRSLEGAFLPQQSLKAMRHDAGRSRPYCCPTFSRSTRGQEDAFSAISVRGRACSDPRDGIA